MHKKLCFLDTSVACRECAPIRIERYSSSHATLLGLMLIRHECEKYGEKHGFSVICVSLHKGPRNKMECYVIQLWPKPHIIHKYRSFHEPFVHRSECGLLRLDHSSVALSKSCSALLPHEYTSGKQNTPNSTISVLFKALCTLDLKPNSYIMHKKINFPDTKAWFVQNVHNSVHKTWWERFLLHYIFSFCSPYTSGRKQNKKHKKCDIFSVISVPLCRTRPSKIRISISELYAKLQAMEKKGRVHHWKLSRMCTNSPLAL